MRLTVNELRRIVAEEVGAVLTEVAKEKAPEGAKGPGAEFLKSTAKKINSAIDDEQDPKLRRALMSLRSAMYDNAVVGEILKSAGINYDS